MQKIKCEKCNCEYDDVMSECPKCHEKNLAQPNDFKPLSMVPVWKQILLFVIGCICFNLITGTISAYLIIMCTTRDFSSAGIEAIKHEIWWSIALNGVAYLLTLIALLLVFFRDLKTLLPSFGNYKAYIAGLVGFGVILLFSILYILFVTKVCHYEMPSSQNETDVEETANNFRLLSFVVFVLIGPICEEITYRAGLFSCLKRISKWIAYPLAVIVFGMIHFTFKGDIVAELVNLPMYLFGGFVLTYVYDHFGFAGSLVAHMLNNTYASFFAVALFRGVIL